MYMLIQCILAEKREEQKHGALEAGIPEKQARRMRSKMHELMYCASPYIMM